jgi:hypothetical protein
MKPGRRFPLLAALLVAALTAFYFTNVRSPSVPAAVTKPAPEMDDFPTPSPAAKKAWDQAVNLFVGDKQMEMSPRFLEGWRHYASVIGPGLLTKTTPDADAGRLLPPVLEGNGIFPGGTAETVRFCFARSNPPMVELRSPEQVNAAIGLEAIAAWNCILAGDKITLLYQDRANALPASVLDLVTFYSVLNGSEDFISSRHFPVIEEIAPYATAKNAIYRLLTIILLSDAIPRGTHERTSIETAEGVETALRRIAVARQYVEETDPIITGYVIHFLATTPLPQAGEVAIQIRGKQLARGRADLAALADATIKQIDAGIAAAKRARKE